MIITNAIDLSADFAALAEKLATAQSEMQTSQSALSESMADKLSHIAQDFTSANEQTSSIVVAAKTEIESVVHDAEQAITESVTATKTALMQKGIVKSVMHIKTDASTVTIPAVDINKTFINMNMTMAIALEGSTNIQKYGYVQAELASGTSINISKNEWNGYVMLEVIEYA